MEMMQYKPWEKNEVYSLIKESNKNLPILDIQLGGACNLNCIYCDTPKYGHPCDVNLSSIEKLINDGNVKWVYICGLGEPTATPNLYHLKQILKLCKEKDIGLSMFSNILNIDDELVNYIDNGTLHVLFKLDTFDKNKMAHLYGKDKGDIILKNYETLNEVVHNQNGVTNLGASIVPTSINYTELPYIINYCMENGIFPLIGQLEDAGSCSKVYKELEVKEKDLIEFRNYISQVYGVDYEMPTCPATIAGMHVTNTNKIILDKRTGLSCPWFWLDEPQLQIIGNIESMSYNEIVKKILDYRKAKLSDVEQMEQNIELYPFGGCGGNAKQLLKTYLDIAKNR
ncbi:MAG: radical SAM protein [Erysipelotrichales bacterium]|nr:radical SAM protein [Erysipelotrichales bacterium]